METRFSNLGINGELAYFDHEPDAFPTCRLQAKPIQSIIKTIITVLKIVLLIAQI